MNGANPYENSFIDYPWGFETLSEEYMQCENYGFMSCATAYFKLDQNVTNDTIYLVSYDLYALPSSGHSKSEMNVYCKVDSNSTFGRYQSLISTSPETTHGQSNFDVSLDPEIAGISAYVSWSYTEKDVKIDNKSNLNTNTIEINHNIDERKIVGSKGYHILPGALIKVSSEGNGGYYGTDIYSTKFCDVVISGLWHNNFKMYQMPVEVCTING